MLMGGGREAGSLAFGLDVSETTWKERRKKHFSR
jgi:hypothetical protein